VPNYDIIPLATDLLDYTIQRVKVKEPQYTKVKAYVMENGQMVENVNNNNCTNTNGSRPALMVRPD